MSVTFFKQLLASLFAIFLLASPILGLAKNFSDGQGGSAILAQPNENDLQEHQHYINENGVMVHSPAHSKSGGIPNGATAQCRDGTYSFSQHRRGTCSHHAGVAAWL